MQSHIAFPNVLAGFKHNAEKVRCWRAWSLAGETDNLHHDTYNS